jgi:uncharacterized protein YjbJ (UPF0337 family)
MSKHGDKAMGKGKEIAGKVTGNKDLEAEGKDQHATGKVKEAAGDVTDKARSAVDAVKDKLPDRR